MDVYDLNSFKIIKKITLDNKILKIKIIEETDLIFSILDNGNLLILKKIAIKSIKRINKEIVVLKNDIVNSIIYFGNSFGNFGAFDYKGNLVFEDKIDDSIRDIAMVNKGNNIIVSYK